MYAANPIYGCSLEREGGEKASNFWNGKNFIKNKCWFYLNIIVCNISKKI
jgi:hypothetical protein